MRYFLVFFTGVYEGNDFTGNQAFSHDVFPCMTEVCAEIEDKFGFSESCVTNIIELNMVDYYNWTGGND